MKAQAPLLKLLAAHKGKAFLAAMFTASTFLLSRGCHFRIDVDPVHARTNAIPVKARKNSP